jgi:dTDP-4-dehydrorhamnose reductase
VSNYRLLLIGANGQLGFSLASALKKLGEVRALTRLDADLSNPWLLDETLKPMVPSFQPHVIVNAAAYTAVDKAQSESDLVRRVNAHSVGYLAELAQSINATLVHYSTDYVFDGSGTRPWVEDDATNPLSIYGQTKWLAEKSVAQHCVKHLILRTSWVVSAHGNNFLKTMLRLAAERDALQVVEDQIGVPTSTELLANITVAMLQSMLQAEPNDKRFGIYHVAPSGETSWHAYAQYVIAGAIKRGANLKVRPDQIEPIPASAYPLPAPRPANSRLNTDKLNKNFGLTLPSWQEGVDAILDDLVGGIGRAVNQ